ncbi:hypothetical protein, partial [Cardiobacterium hominis]|uniref:hypothetical protein n=1 Tax=Cardiobacterium hominis TaxID=2718 RepID=UPI00249172FF
PYNIRLTALFSLHFVQYAKTRLVARFFLFRLASAVMGSNETPPERGFVRTVSRKNSNLARAGGFLPL